MALSDIGILYDGGHSDLQARRFAVHLGVASGIKAGELVRKTLGSPYVTRFAPGVATTPIVTANQLGTQAIVGLAATSSTETTSANGTVDVIPMYNGIVYLAVPNAPTSWDTQAKYDALVGSRVLLDVSSTGVQTILAADGVDNGLVVEPLDIAKHPSKVAFSIRRAMNYLA